MNSTLFEKLLDENESATLDFKRDQYSFAGANDYQKSEILKDILAFANAERKTAAYILIGVEEVKGGRSKVVGVAAHLDDASLQQFVNSKTRRPVIFSYREFAFEGKQIGVLEIPLQANFPSFLTVDYGKLRKNAVYTRIGSSTSEIEPDEVAKLCGLRAAQVRALPRLDLQFADVDNRRSLTRIITVNSDVLHYDHAKLDPQSYPFAVWLGGLRDAKERVERLAKKEALRQVGFVLTNVGEMPARNIVIEIVSKTHSPILIVDETQYLKETQEGLTANQTNEIGTANLSVNHHGGFWTLTARFGGIQPKATAWSSRFYVGGNIPYRLRLEAKIFADNLPEPTIVPLQMNIATRNFLLDVDAL